MEQQGGPPLGAGDGLALTTCLQSALWRTWRHHSGDIAKVLGSDIWGPILVPRDKIGFRTVMNASKLIFIHIERFEGIDIDPAEGS
jgi:hypothetical protein